LLNPDDPKQIEHSAGQGSDKMHRLMSGLSSLGVVLILWFAGLCAAAQFAKIGLILPELQQLYPDAGPELGFLITLISLVGALLGLIAGIVVGEVGPRRILIHGLLIGALISLIQSLDIPLIYLLISRVFEGISHLAIVVAAPMLIAHHSNERMRSAAMTLWGTFFGVSFALTAWLGLPLVGKHGIHALFFVHAVLIGASAMAIAWLLPKPTIDTEGDLNEDRSSYTPNSLTFSALKQRHRQAWLSPYIAAPATGWLFYTITFVSLLAVLPGLVPSEERALLAYSMPIASIISSMSLGVLLLRWCSATQVVNIGFLVAIIISITFLFSSNKTVLGIMLFSALGLVQGASFAAIPQLNPLPANQALAYGTFAQAGNIGNLIGTPLLLTLLSYGGSAVMITAVVACYGTAVIFNWMLNKRRKV